MAGARWASVIMFSLAVICSVSIEISEVRLSISRTDSLWVSQSELSTDLGDLLTGSVTIASRHPQYM